MNNLTDREVNCMMLHPIYWPNKGKVIELSLAQEALGLVATLNWESVKGPKVPIEEEEESTADKSEVRDEMDDERRPVKTLLKSENIAMFKKEKIHDGDYVYAPGGVMEGVYFKGGIIIKSFRQLSQHITL